MKYINLGKFSIHITSNVLSILESYKQLKLNQKESGGIILGEVNDFKIYITKLSLPSKFDKSSRYSFTRAKDIAQLIINHEFTNSNGKTIYLGEWHTHPEKNPTPSGTDDKMIKDQLDKNHLNIPCVLQLIQGTGKCYIRLLQDKDVFEFNFERNYFIIH